jgi:serine/threonine protein kinase/tetratricopeptide (TPR) repeat protein
MAQKCPKCETVNAADSKFCKECATPLPSGAMGQASFTLTLETTPDELARGTLFAGRYEIIEELGAGGMGRVYRAHDTKLNEEVALKLIKPEIAADKRTAERFRNELKVARKIRHKNVCGMYDFHEEGKTLFLTMEYVRGEDLKSLIHRTKTLSVGTALAVARQIAEGLGEAHKLGITHRDLKPGNVMIDKDGQAKVMDFGIARSLHGGGITGEGAIIGTPEYMSPEQVEGKPADPRADIYALGIILFEMVTGRVPFEGDTAFSIANKHKSEPPPVPKKLVPQIPEGLNKLILKCLEKDKDKRYQTAEELIVDIEVLEQALPATDRALARVRTKIRPSREITVKLTPKKLLIPAGGLLVLVIAAFILIPIVFPPSAVPPTEKPSLVVLPFENLSKDSGLDKWCTSFPELLTFSLSASKYLNVLRTDEIIGILKKLKLTEARALSSADLKQIAREGRANSILKASFIQAGETFIVTAHLINGQTGQTLATLGIEARNENEVISKVNELTRRIKEGLNLTSNQIADDVEEDAGKLTASPKALEYYVEGRKLLYSLEYEQSIAYLEKAVEVDPEFAMAYRALAAAHSNLGHIAEVRKYYKKALDLSARLPEYERLLNEGSWFCVEEDYAKAIEVFERLVKIYPGFRNARRWLAWSYWAVGNLDKAIEHGEIVAKENGDAISVVNLARSYLAKGLYKNAEDVCQSFLQYVSDNGFVRYYLFCSYLGRRQFDLALAEAEKLYLLGPSWKFLKAYVLFCKDDFVGAEKTLTDDSWQQPLLLARGKINEAIGLSRKNIEKSKGDKEKEIEAYGGLAGTLEKAGRYEDAYQAFGQYLKLASERRKLAGESRTPNSASEQRADLFAKGRIQAEMGSFDEAKKTAQELSSLIGKGINTKQLRAPEYILGLIELGKKNYRQAADLFGRACGRLDFEAETAPDSSIIMILDWTLFERHAPFFDKFARALFESGDLDKARKTYENITLLTSGRYLDGDIYAKAFYMLGKIAEQMGKKAEAAEKYRKFLDLWKDADPGLPEVEDARKRLASL